MAISPFQLQTNPYANFDPSQWSNPYSNYQNQALPQASYVGWPTDWQGNPIQAPAGMTINQTPAQPAAPASTPLASTGGLTPWQRYQQAVATGQPWTGGSVANSAALSQLQHGAMPSPQALAGLFQGQQAQQAQQAAPAAMPQVNSAGLTPQQYMALRANPGPVVTPGATVPQAQPGYQPSSGVLQQFLANWQPAQSGAGSGFQQGFANALKGMGY